MDTLKKKPLVIAGPCMGESFNLMDEVAGNLVDLAQKLGFELIFKASFDKANRTSIKSFRGPGLETAMTWFSDIKEKYNVRVLTDVHECIQVEPVAKVCDVLQIPAFLCRQTDLLVAAVRTGNFVNVKKGQFMAPSAMSHVVEKVKEATGETDPTKLKLSLTERGASFGYGDLVVDMRSLAIMKACNVPVIYDVTHSTQQPAAHQGTSGALRQYAALLARSAAATGQLSGFFLEVHTDPKIAKSDGDAQLTPEQAEVLLRQLVPLWRGSLGYTEEDRMFMNSIVN